MCGSVHHFSQPFLQDEFAQLACFQPTLITVPLSPGFVALSRFGFPSTELTSTADQLYALAQSLEDSAPSTSSTIPLYWRSVLRSAQYKLLAARDRDALEHPSVIGSRLGLLIFSAVIQKELRPSHIHKMLLQRLRELLEERDCTSVAEQELRLWLIFTTAEVLHCPADRSALQHCLQDLQTELCLHTWEHACVVLKRFPWVQRIQGSQGRLLWDETVRSVSVSDTYAAISSSL